MFLIVITGHSATGKTTLGRKIAKELNIPFLSKDDFKEILFDTIGFKDREWSQKIGKASYEILYNVLEENLKSNNSVVIESNFEPRYANIKLNKLKEKYKFIPFQIRCFADREILYERFVNRINSGERHLGHSNNTNIGELKHYIKDGKIEALYIGGKLYDIDTTDFKTLDYNKLFNAINNSTN